MQQIVFKYIKDTYSFPNPDISNRTIVIIVQNGGAKIGKYEEPTPPENPMPSFSHPANSEKLKEEAL